MLVSWLVSFCVLLKGYGTSQTLCQQRGSARAPPAPHQERSAPGVRRQKRGSTVPQAIARNSSIRESKSPHAHRISRFSQPWQALGGVEAWRHGRGIDWRYVSSCQSDHIHRLTRQMCPGRPVNTSKLSLSPDTEPSNKCGSATGRPYADQDMPRPCYSLLQRNTEAATSEKIDGMRLLKRATYQASARVL